MNKITTRSAPGWGRAIGIIMIILGGMGVFFNFYRLLMPSIFNFQRRLMHDMRDVNPNPEARKVSKVLDEMLYFDNTMETLIYIFSTVGIVVCILYIIGGVKLLKPRPKNYNFARAILFAAIFVALLFYIFMFAHRFSFFIFAMMFYSFFGTICDITLLIILSASNKSAYGFSEIKEFGDYSKASDEDIL